MGQKHRKILTFQLFVRPARGALVACAEAFATERARWPLWLPVLLGIGIGLYFALDFEPPMWLGWVGVVGFAAVSWALRARGHAARAFFALGLAALALGTGLAGLSTWRAAAPMLARETGPVTVTGQAVILEPRPKGARVTLSHVAVQRLAPDRTPAAVRVTLSGAQPEFQAGDWLKLRASLSPPPAPAAPGAFDFQRQSYFRGLGAVGFAYGRAQIIGGAPKRGMESLAFEFDHLRQKIAQRVQAQLPGDVGAVAAALMTGQRAQVSDAVLDDLRASGLAHLLAISGLHVGLVAGIVFFAVRAGLALASTVALRYPVKKWAAAVALAVALFYALLAGWTVPTQRAFLMVGVMLAAVLVERRALNMRTVAWAALVILAFAPEALLGASFQLSFAAVVALVAVFEALSGRGWFAARTPGVFARTARYVAGVALTTMVAGAATAAFAAFHFNRVADYGLAANLVAVPITALWIMPWAVAAFALMPLGLEGLALAPLGLGVEALLAVARTVAAWPGAQQVVAAFPIWGLALIALGGLWAAIWRTRWRVWGMLPLGVGLLTIAMSRTPDVLIDVSGELAAVKVPGGGYRVSTLAAKRFERDVWLRRAGLSVAEGRWPPARPGAADLGIRCDALGCLYGAPGTGFDVAFVHAPEALAEDCVRARVVVNLSVAGTRKPEACAAEVVIGLDDLTRDGAHALYFGADGAIQIETVRGARGARPWVVPWR